MGSILLSKVVKKAFLKRHHLSKGLKEVRSRAVWISRVNVFSQRGQFIEGPEWVQESCLKQSKEDEFVRAR